MNTILAFVITALFAFAAEEKKSDEPKQPSVEQKWKLAQKQASLLRTQSQAQNALEAFKKLEAEWTQKNAAYQAEVEAVRKDLGLPKECVFDEEQKAVCPKPPSDSAKK